MQNAELNSDVDITAMWHGMSLMFEFDVHGEFRRLELHEDDGYGSHYTVEFTQLAFANGAARLRNADGAARMTLVDEDGSFARAYAEMRAEIE